MKTTSIRAWTVRAAITLAAAITVPGCAQHEEKAPLLHSAFELSPNAGETIRVIGTARYLKVVGPSVAGADFDVRVYPKTAWGPELDGKQVEVTGRLNDSRQTTPPDPSINPGEYWLSDVKWTPYPPPEEKR